VRFERLVSQYGDALQRLVATYELNRSDRDDLFQEIAIGIWRALPTFRNECSERTFVYRIAHNTAISHGRRATTRRRFVDLALARDHADPGPAPDEACAKDDMRVRLLSAVQSLSPAIRQATVLSLEGLSNIEIAEVLGVSAGSIAVRLSRARTELSRFLESYQ
jgi:RNA polymerase sigma-70 factor (ECF subfamily)